MATPRRVFLAVDDPQLRSALRLLLENQDGVEVVGESRGGGGTVALAGAAGPDLVLLSWSVIRGASLELVPRLRALPTHPRVIVLSARPEERAACQAAADACVCQGESPDRLLAAVRGLGCR